MNLSKKQLEVSDFIVSLINKSIAFNKPTLKKLLALYSNVDNKNKILIDNSYSEYRGFYELLFKLILTKTPITMIFGGYRQSHRAINSWKKD